MDKKKDITIKSVIKKYFNAIPDKEDEVGTIEGIKNGVDFRGASLWILVFAIFIASLGLNVNSTAVIIGAMLISPLMGPIIGMGLAVGINDFDLLKRSIKSYIVATLISVLTATVYFVLSPFSEAQSELLARTSPTLYDVLIAFFGGAAGIVALTTKGKGNVIPGVAIATALMPPLCTAGYGLATGQLNFFFGAFYLFFINTVFIALSTFLGVRMLRFKPKVFVNTDRLHKVKKYIIVVVVVTMLPAAYLTVQILRTSLLDNQTNEFIKKELSFKGTQIISQSRDDSKKTIRVVAIGNLITRKMIDKAQEQLAGYRLKDYKVNVIQGYQSDSLLILNKRLANSTQTSEASNQQLLNQSNQIHELQKRLHEYSRYKDLSKNIGKEIRPLFPQARTVSLSLTYDTHTDSAYQSKYVTAVVGWRGTLSNIDRTRLQQWLKVKSGTDSLRLITTTAKKKHIMYEYIQRKINTYKICSLSRVFYTPFPIDSLRSFP